MNEKEWNVKRTCYICACITSDFVGTAVLWNTSEEAWKDAEERVEAFIEGEEARIYYKKVSDGYEIRDKFSHKVIRCLKRRSWSNEKRMDR